MRYAAEAQISVEERAFTVEEAKGAAEAFVTSASAFVMPVVEIEPVPSPEMNRPIASMAIGASTQTSTAERRMPIDKTTDPSSTTCSRRMRS